MFDPIHITQQFIPSSYSHLGLILLLDDKEVERLGDWTIGFHHCKQCGTYEAYAHKLPPLDRYGQAPVDAAMHNSRNAFWRKHAHGDGRILLFEKDLLVCLMCKSLQALYYVIGGNAKTHLCTDCLEKYKAMLVEETGSDWWDENIKVVRIPPDPF